MYSVSRRTTTGTIPRTLDLGLHRLDPYLLKTRAPRTQEEEELQQKEEEETVAAATMRTMATATVATMTATTATAVVFLRNDDLYYEYCRPNELFPVSHHVLSCVRVFL